MDILGYMHTTLPPMYCNVKFLSIRICFDRAYLLLQKNAYIRYELNELIYLVVSVKEN